MRNKMFCFVLLLGMLLPLSSAMAEEEMTVETSGEVAKINDSVITAVELNRELAMIQQRFAENGRSISDSQLTEIRNEVLDRLVRRELIYGVCRKEGIKAEPTEIEEAFQVVKARYNDDDSFQKMMDRFNLTEEIIKKEIAREIAIKKMIDDRFAKNITVTEEQAREYYEKSKNNFLQPESVHASHILIKVEENAPAEEKEKARERIVEIQKKLKEGGDFAALAKEFSEGPSAPNSGDLGFFRRGQMVKPFEDAAFALQPGEISEVVKTRFGYHLIKVMERNAESTVPFEEMKDRITMYLKQEKLQAEVNDYVEGLRKSSNIVLF